MILKIQRIQIYLKILFLLQPLKISWNQKNQQKMEKIWKTYSKILSSFQNESVLTIYQTLLMMNMFGSQRGMLEQIEGIDVGGWLK